MSAPVWSFKSYKDFLNTLIHEGQRGLISRLAEAAGCQRSYLSNVLRTHIHLVPDQAFGICRYLGFDPSETSYFLLLLEKERAATPTYRQHLEEKITILQKEREDLAQRLERKPLQSDADQLIYYSAWHYAAIHILVSIPKFQSVPAICQALGIDSELVHKTLTELARMGLVQRLGSRWSFSSGDIHIPKNSPLVSLHHNNWRQKAVLRSQARGDGIHFTMVQSVSTRVADEIKEKVLKLIDEANALAGPSEPEELIYFGIDQYKIT
ncbi:MAG: DUF4423 domain-containing protein [Bdellovibrionia bacterium]